jgi:hypothetical protein
MMFEFLKRKSKHEHLNEMLSPYINGELSSEERAGLEKHLAECEACVRNLHALRLTVELLGQLPKVPLPRPFFVRKEVASRVFRTVRAYAYLKGATAFAAALLIIVLASDALMQFAFMGLEAPPKVEVRVPKEVEVTEEVVVEVAVEAVPSPLFDKFLKTPQPSLTPLAKRPPTEVEIYAIPEPTEEEARQIPAPTATPPTEFLAELPTPEVPSPLEYGAPSAPAWLIPIRLLKAFLFLLFIILLAIALLVRRSIP